MRTIPDLLLGLLVPGLILLHLLVAPYTKVEESFNLQATHDILTYGIPTHDIATYLRTNYDHFSFPGVVPRTFLGALLLAVASKPGIALGMDQQFVGFYNASALLTFRHAVARRFGRGTGNWYLLFQASQFHVIYYASRTLPNMMAFGLVTLSLANLPPFLLETSTSKTASKRRYRLAVYLLTIVAVVLRVEVAIFLACMVGYHFLRRGQSILPESIFAGVVGGTVGLLATLCIDSFFWQKFLVWPELVGFYYNAVRGKSVDWGTSPWYYYFLNTLPRLLMNPVAWLLCLPMAVAVKATRQPSLDVLLPSVLFVSIYSSQGHKEWRFIVYVLPGLTAVAAMAADWIWIRRTKTILYRILSLVLIVSSLATFIVSLLMLVISSFNYPGAEALQRLHHHLAHQEHSSSSSLIRIHSDTLSCTTGITRFLEKQQPAVRHHHHRHRQRQQPFWIYDKTEDARNLTDPFFWSTFDYALAENPDVVLGHWDVVDVAYGFVDLAFTRSDVDDDRASVVEAEAGVGHRPSTTTTTTITNLIMSNKALRAWMQTLKSFVTTYLTRGRWVDIKMKPRITILKRHTLPAY